ncbi:lysophospholipid acyltransferase family protein [methane-oxidizing endosymbiont of Gigantopelta aegis]|uniref:lysophospholipid acyltransferase family protein n=1 Tax=methane-oxidizing endosymbiont of Gigantopelta aegis TaxID=2794938 RepID=UPI0018DBC494|nr:lysophospholipid acyltransferase family protein [methane-oxidizing endosymbiont of Gigantopelta aegis]
MKRQTQESKKNNLRVYIGSTLFFLYIIVSTVIFGPIILLCVILPFEVRYKLSKLWVKWLLAVLKVTCGLSYSIEGIENILQDQPCVVLCKHQSAWETVALRLFLPRQTAVLKKSLTWIPIGGWALATLKPIAIDRKNQREALKMLIEQGTQRLQEGLFVIVFPEGTRAAPGENKKFNAGGAMLAQKSGYPVLPIAHNAGEFWPRNSFLKYPGVIKVKIGPIISVKGKKAKEINEEAAAWIKKAMEEISQAQ